MLVFTGVILYLLIGWLALFCVLPVSTRPDSQGKLEEGGWRGAAQKHLMAGSCSAPRRWRGWFGWGFGG
jgi:predicted secreted protein